MLWKYLRGWGLVFKWLSLPNISGVGSLGLRKMDWKAFVDLSCVVFCCIVLLRSTILLLLWSCFRVVGQCTDEFLVQDSNYQAFGCCERSEKYCGLVCSRIFFGFGGSLGFAEWFGRCLRSCVMLCWGGVGICPVVRIFCWVLAMSTWIPKTGPNRRFLWVFGSLWPCLQLAWISGFGSLGYDMLLLLLLWWCYVVRLF